MDPSTLTIQDETDAVKEFAAAVTMRGLVSSTPDLTNCDLQIKMDVASLLLAGEAKR